MKNIIWASLLSTISIAVAMAVVNLLGMVFSNDFSSYSLAVAGMMIFVSGLVGGLFVLFLGVPLHFLLMRRNFNSVYPYVLTGFFVAFGFVLIATPFGNDRNIEGQALHNKNYFSKK